MKKSSENNKKEVTSDITEKRPFNKMAIASLVLSIVAIRLNIFGILSFMAIIFSAISLIQIGKTKERGAIMAIIALILGIIVPMLFLGMMINFTL